MKNSSRYFKELRSRRLYTGLVLAFVVLLPLLLIEFYSKRGTYLTFLALPIGLISKEVAKLLNPVTKN